MIHAFDEMMKNARKNKEKLSALEFKAKNKVEGYGEEQKTVRASGNRITTN